MKADPRTRLRVKKKSERGCDAVLCLTRTGTCLYAFDTVHVETVSVV
jgi:hypothetical protein